MGKNIENAEVDEILGDIKIDLCLNVYVEQPSIS